MNLEKVIDRMKSVGISPTLMTGNRDKFTCSIDLETERYRIFDVEADGSTLAEALVMALIETWVKHTEIENAADAEKVDCK